ncbi:MAG: hypothetical protein AMS27_10525 [Bacteroides sp. SM23_62_1]|nr:MAG: hypothetical protein AMS27_10525 [Bacteroides sp. SM23_62_1]
MIRIFIFIAVFFISINASSQISILEDSITLKLITRGVNLIYNYEFCRAQDLYDSIAERLPDHPVLPFYQGLIHYWGNLPVTPGGPGAEDFEKSMEDVIRLSNQVLDENQDDIEALFYNLASRSFLILYYADNGLPAKVFIHLGSIYRSVMKAFDLQDQFVDFYFYTGLYNYYVEAYPEAHPIYYPFTLLCKRGDKEAGLKMLDYAFNHAYFLRPESANFLSIIYLAFEDSSSRALHYMRELHERYPDNDFFLSRYAELLLMNKDYELAKPIIDTLFYLDDFNVMKAYVFRGIYKEFHLKNPEKAKDDYLKGVDLAVPFGPRADYQVAYAYIGLSRYYRDKGDSEKARYFYKKARESISYPYVYEN